MSENEVVGYGRATIGGASKVYRGGAGRGPEYEKPWGPADGPEKLTLQRDIAALVNVVSGLEGDLTGLVKRLEPVLAVSINLDEAPATASSKRSETGHMVQAMVCRLEKCRAVIAQIMDSVEL